MIKRVLICLLSLFIHPVYAMPRTVNEDPLQKYMFRVSIPGYPAGLGFTKISGFIREIGVIEYSEGMFEYFHKLAGRQKVTDISFERGAYLDDDMINIYKATLTDPKHRTTVTVEILNRYGETGRTYVLAEAWASKLEVSDLDAASDDVVIDKMTISFEYFLDDESALQQRG